MKVLTETGAIKAWASIMLLIVGFGLALGLTIAYVNRVDRRAEQRSVERARDICGIIVIVDDRNQRIDNPTADQRTFIDEVHRYRAKLGC